MNRVTSQDGRFYIEIYLDNQNLYRLIRYQVKYDSEEDVEYTVELKPRPSSIFENLTSAREEAKRLVG